MQTPSSKKKKVQEQIAENIEGDTKCLLERISSPKAARSQSWMSELHTEQLSNTDRQQRS